MNKAKKKEKVSGSSKTPPIKQAPEVFVLQTTILTNFKGKRGKVDAGTRITRESHSWILDDARLSKYLEKVK